MFKQPPSYKGDCDEIVRYLQEEGVECLYHFTDRSNLDSIRKYGLLSYETCAKMGVTIPRPGGNELSRKLDLQHHLLDFVRLSFSTDHPMMGRLKRQGYDLVLLKVDLRVAGFLQAFYSDRNATENSFEMGSDLSFLKRLNESAQTDVDMYKQIQAEVLVRSFIPADFILNLESPIQVLF